MGAEISQLVHTEREDTILPVQRTSVESVSQFLSLPEALMREVCLLLDIVDLARLESAFVRADCRIYIQSVLASQSISSSRLLWDIRTLEWATRRNFLVEDISLHCSLPTIETMRFAGLLKNVAQLDISPSYRPGCSEHLSIASKQCSNLRSLHIGSVQNVNMGHLVSLAKNATNLTTLHVKNSPEEIAMALTAILRDAHSLRHLHLTHCSVSYGTNVSMWAPSAGQLQTLDLSWAHISDLSIATILQNCRSLTTLDLDFCTGLAGSGLLRINELCPKLTTLSLRGLVTITSTMWEFSLATLAPQLLVLRLTIPSAESPGQFHRTMQRCSPQLQELSVNFHSGMHGNWRPQEVWRGFRCLTSLTWAQCREIPAREFVDMTTSLRCLTAFDVRDTSIDDTALHALVTNSPGLKDLNVSNCHGVTDAGVCAIAAGCTNLQALNCAFLRRVSDVSLLALGTHCPWLHELVMSGNVQVSDAGVLALAQGCKHLGRVNLTHCPLVSDTAVDALLRHCRRLAVLTVSNCPRIDEDRVEALLKERRWSQYEGLRKRDAAMDTRWRAGGEYVARMQY